MQAHPAACASALAVQKAVEKENLIARVQDMGKVLGHLLHQIVGPLPLVGDIRGRGLFWAVEFMLHEPDRVPPPREAKFGEKVVNRALQLGLNILGNLGVTGEVFVDHVILCPPYIVTEEELHSIVCILAEAIQDVTEEMKSWFSVSPKASGKPNGHVNGVAKIRANGHIKAHTNGVNGSSHANSICS